jgi:Uma2 family endonuclease
MAVEQFVSAETYQRIALGDDDRLWELHDGRMVEKPGMSAEHGDVPMRLVVTLGAQLDRREFRLRSNHARLRHPGGSYFVPDVAVIPTEVERAQRGRPGTLEIYEAPLPLVVEVWSPSTGDYDIAAKLQRYQERGDDEIWFLHPYERALTRWVRRPGGGYEEATQLAGVVRPAFLPGVVIDLDDLFED